MHKPHGVDINGGAEEESLPVGECHRYCSVSWALQVCQINCQAPYSIYSSCLCSELFCFHRGNHSWWLNYEHFLDFWHHVRSSWNSPALSHQIDFEILLTNKFTVQNVLSVFKGGVLPPQSACSWPDIPEIEDWFQGPVTNMTPWSSCSVGLGSQEVLQKELSSFVIKRFCHKSDDVFFFLYVQPSFFNF